MKKPQILIFPCLNHKGKKTQTPTATRSENQSPRLRPVKRFQHTVLFYMLAAGFLASATVHAENIRVSANCSLTQAIQAANQDQVVAGCLAGKGRDILILPVASKIVLNKSFDHKNAFPPITSDIIIDGRQSVLQRDQGAENFRFFSVNYGARLTLKDLYLQGGRQGPGGAVFVQYDARLRIENSKLTGNSSLSGKGGAIESRGDVVISRSVISHNWAGFAGGGLHMTDGSLILDRSTVSHNISDGAEGGAGVMLLGGSSSTIKNSTISNNKAATGAGGGIRIRNSYPSEIDIISSTIAANKAHTSGGGIDHDGHLHLSHTIVSGNQAQSASEISAKGIVEANAYNIFGHSGQAGIQGIELLGSEIIPVQPLNNIIGPLKDNGGPTHTHGLVSGSPAIDAGDIAFQLPATDQRGVARPYGDGVDIGAVEVVLAASSVNPSLEQQDVIRVDGIKCKLQDAINAALEDRTVAGCSAGQGIEDIIALQPGGSFLIDESLPAIRGNHGATSTHKITIDGQGATIKASQGSATENILQVIGVPVSDHATPVLRLNNLTLSGASESAIKLNKGQIFLNQTTISDSKIGVLVAEDADLFVHASTIANNRVGGIIATYNALLVVDNSTISSNGWPGLMVGPLVRLRMSDTTVSANGGRGMVLYSHVYRPELNRNLIAGNGLKLGQNKNREILQNQYSLSWEGGFNLIGQNGFSGAASSTLIETDHVPSQPIQEILVPLAENGGPTRTHALVAASPAIDVAGLDCSGSDQRGLSRSQSGFCDAGAYEMAN
ncbi:MAG: right-handed parallel beta-helix repeat-containing protein [Gammaproteobacteria bacterium]|nr:right-handed parallel beta-helix repeat-containing protein [Gammaproteobacteria bacterium]